VKLMSDFWKMAAHWKGAPWMVWQVVQWQNFALRGFSREISYLTLPQWHPPSYNALNPSFLSWTLYGSRNFHSFSSPSRSLDLLPFDLAWECSSAVGPESPFFSLVEDIVIVVVVERYLGMGLSNVAEINGK